MRDTRGHLPLFQPDYIISWDFSDKDLPCVVISQVTRDKTFIKSEVLGVSHAAAGCVSLRQVLDDFLSRKLEEVKNKSELDALRQKFRTEEKEVQANE